MAKVKKQATRGQTFGKAVVPRTRVAILDGTGGKDKYLAKYTVYNLDPTTVQTRVKELLESMQKDWEAGRAA